MPNETTDAPEGDIITANTLIHDLGSVIQEMEFHLMALRRFANNTDQVGYRQRVEAVISQMQLCGDALTSIARNYADFILPSGHK